MANMHHSSTLPVGPLRWTPRADFLKTVCAFKLQVKDSTSMNNVHLVILAVEGVLLTWLSVIYMWHMAQEVDRQRFNVYSVFIAIPTVRTRHAHNHSLTGLSAVVQSSVGGACEVGGWCASPSPCVRHCACMHYSPPASTLLRSTTDCPALGN